MFKSTYRACEDKLKYRERLSISAELDAIIIERIVLASLYQVFQIRIANFNVQAHVVVAVWNIIHVSR